MLSYKQIKTIDPRTGELEYFRSLLATLEAGETALAIESVSGAISVLEAK